MTDLVRLSKRLSYVLRHNPGRVGLTLDPQGWVPVADVLAALRLTRDQLDTVVATNDKRRFAVEGDLIRANQGHSVRVDLALTPESPPAVLYHGTPAMNLASIHASGLLKQNRHHVHLSADVETARRVGRRRTADVAV